jgi:ABC-2 type transport system permease protein/oleandomycin transport system permease protein
MTTVAAPLDLTPTSHNRVVQALLDIRAVTIRNLTTYRRVPQLLVFSTIQPVILVLLFRYVFGGAIRIPGVDYVDYLMPGIFVQTVIFGSISTGIGLANDLHTGLIERFRSLPMARSAVLAGRTLADSTRNILVLILMCTVGYAVGWRVSTDVLSFLGGMALLLLFGYAMSWVFATAGLLVGDPEATQAATFPIIAPLVFASSAFVAVATMPGWLQGFARNQPLSVVVNAVRDLTLGSGANPGGGSTAHDVLLAVAWCVGIVAIAAPISVAIYRRKNTR